MRDRNFHQGQERQPYDRGRHFYGGPCRPSRDREKNRVVFGIGLALVGVVLLLRTMGLLPYFDFDLSWPVILIVIGLLLGIKNNFRRNAWWILIFIGAVNLIPSFMIMGRPSRHFVWPSLVIVAGLMVAFRPRRQHDRLHKVRQMSTIINNENTLDIDVTFGGRKEVVTSKDFQGGAINVTFGGCELNLTQADFTTPSVVIDCRVSFGGVEIIVPSHWEIQNEVSPSFGSVEDERTIQTPAGNEMKKTLIIRGNCSFGSIEIKSY
jgi:predicted membrane protein